MLAEKYFKDTQVLTSTVNFGGEADLTPLAGEETENIMLNDLKVGVYYKERNFINYYFNPFNLIELPTFKAVVPKLFIDIIKEFERLKIKVTKTNGIQQKLFVEAFLSKSRTTLHDVDVKVETRTRDIITYENKIRQDIGELFSLNAQKNFLSNAIEENGVIMFSEIEKARKLPFVKSIEMKTDEIHIKFNPTFLPMPNYKRIDYQKGFGKRYVYLGSITFIISPDDFSLKSDSPINGHAHPHASGNPGNPCFGDGEGRNNIYNALAIMRFADLTKLLWFWIKTYRDGGAYIHGGAITSYILSHGLPMFDDKGKRIEINEPARLKSEEQQELKKENNYITNIAKYKNIRLS